MLNDSPEFSFLNKAPLESLGIHLMELLGSSQIFVRKKWWARGDKAPLQPPGRLDFHGQADVGTPMGSKVAQEPQEIFKPDVVSATDPAYSLRPVSRAPMVEGLGKVPTAQESGSPWTQWRPKSRAMKTNTLLAALQPKGLDPLYSKQGASPYG